MNTSISLQGVFAAAYQHRVEVMAEEVEVDLLTENRYALEYCGAVCKGFVDPFTFQRAVEIASEGELVIDPEKVEHQVMRKINAGPEFGEWNRWYITPSKPGRGAFQATYWGEL